MIRTARLDDPSLYIACSNQNTNLARMLLENGADVNEVSGGLTALDTAVGYNNKPLVQLLLKYNANIEREWVGWCPGVSLLSNCMMIVKSPTDPDDPDDETRRSISRMVIKCHTLRQLKIQVRKRTCARCRTRASLDAPKMQKCGGCFEPRYCSRACQSADWDADHKHVCSRKKLVSSINL